MVSGPGLTAAVASAILNGSYGLFGKVPSVQRAHVPPLAFNFHVSCGIVLSSLLTLIAQPLAWTPWGLLSGVLFVLSTACTFPAINMLGLSSAAGIWSGTAILVSFVFAVRFQGDVIRNAGLAAGGITCLCLGLAAIAGNGAVVGRRHARRAAAHAEEGPHTGGHPSQTPTSALLAPNTQGTRLPAAAALGSEDAKRVGEGGEDAATAPAPTSVVAGIILSVMTGFFGGLILAPLGHTGLGINYVPSMAVGVVMAAPVVTFSALFLCRQPLNLHPRAAAAPGIAAGCLWNASNVLAIVATRDPGVGLAVSYPILQCGLLVAGLWGIILYRELKGKEQIAFWLGGCVVILGACLLAVAK